MMGEPVILTLCEDCAALYALSCGVGAIKFQTKTEKKPKCEHCGKSDSKGLLLKQYLIRRKKNVF